MKGWIVLLFTCCHLILLAANTKSIIGSRGYALGGCSIALPDVWVTANNPAGLTRLEKLAVGTFFSNAFLVKELSRKGLAISYPMKRWGVGLYLSHYGYTRYNEVTLGASTALRLGSRLSIGIQLNYFRISQGGDFPSTNNLSYAIGAFYKTSEKIQVGLLLFNPFPVISTNELSKDNSTQISLGLNWRIVESFSCFMELNKAIQESPILRIGLEYTVAKPFFLRVGMLTNPMQATFGLGLNWRKFHFDLSGSYHPVLGYSPNASIILDFD